MYLHFCQVLHASWNLPSEGDQVALGECPLVWVLQVARVTVAIVAHVAGPHLPALSQEVTQRPILGILHDQIQWTWRKSRNRSPAYRFEPNNSLKYLITIQGQEKRMKEVDENTRGSYHLGCRLHTSLWHVDGWPASTGWTQTWGHEVHCERHFLWEIEEWHTVSIILI